MDYIIVNYNIIMKTVSSVNIITFTLGKIILALRHYYFNFYFISLMNYENDINLYNFVVRFTIIWLFKNFLLLLLLLLLL